MVPAVTPTTTRTPVIIVEDNIGIAFLLAEQLRTEVEQLQPYDMNGQHQIVASGYRLLRTLDAQPDESVRLIILDYVLSDGECIPVLARLRDEEGKNAHPALHPEARIIGWSANDQSVTTFRAARADGFISKHRDHKMLIKDVLQLLQQLDHADWAELR
jgi:CheY-like chemotaxis protein